MTVSHDSENMKPKIDLKHKFYMWTMSGLALEWTFLAILVTGNIYFLSFPSDHTVAIRKGYLI